MSYIFLFIIIAFPSALSSIPNFVIFLADDLGYGDLGCFGNYSIKTPNIDKLAGSGIKLTHHLTADAVCTPSRAAFLTGRYPLRSGMASSNRNKVFFFVAASGGLPSSEITFAQALKKKQYSTALIGKWHLGNDCIYKSDGCHHPLNHGFDYFYGLPLSNFKDFGDNGESVITAYVPHFYTYIITVIVIGITFLYFTCKKNKIWCTLVLFVFIIIPIISSFFLLNLKIINGILMENREVIEQPIRLKGLTQRFVHKAKQFLNKQSFSNKPFLLYMPFVHVHTALFCASEFSGRSAHGRYGDNVEEMDWAVGEVIKTLEDLSMLNNTFIYFSSDNGAHIEEVGHDGQKEGGFNGVLKGGKMMGGMEGGIRVPSIISWPEKVAPKEINILTSQMDIFPTMLDITGLPLPNDRIIDGKSLVPVITGNLKHHKIVFHYCGKFIHAATYIPDQGNNKWKVHWITPKFIPGTDRCPYVCHCFGEFIIHHEPPLLYNLVNDISESHPIDVSSNKKYLEIISLISNKRREHEKTIKNVTDQFSFSNSVWKPWLQPCCNFPFCKCTDPDF